MNRLDQTRILVEKIADDPGSEGDVARFIARDGCEAGSEAGQYLVVACPRKDELLSRECEHALDHQVIDRHRFRKKSYVVRSFA